MGWIRRFQSTLHYFEDIGKWCVYISAMIIVASYISKPFGFGKTAILVYIRDHIIGFSLLIVSVAVIILMGLDFKATRTICKRIQG